MEDINYDDMKRMEETNLVAHVHLQQNHPQGPHIDLAIIEGVSDDLRSRVCNCPNLTGKVISMEIFGVVVLRNMGRHFMGKTKIADDEMSVFVD